MKYLGALLATGLITLLVYAAPPLQKSHVKQYYFGYAQGVSSDFTETKDRGSYIIQALDATPASGTFTANSSDDTLTVAASLYLGAQATVSSAGGTLAGGLSGGVTYYAIPVSATAMKLATSLANAQAGTAINLSTDGTGTQSIIPLGLTSASFQAQCSNDDSIWVNNGNAQNLTASTTTTILQNINNNGCRYVRMYMNMTSGQVAVSMTSTYRD